MVDIEIEDCCDYLEVDEDRMIDNREGMCGRWENVRVWTTENMNETYTARRITDNGNMPKTYKYTTLAIRFLSDCIHSERGFRMSYVRSEYEDNHEISAKTDPHLFVRRKYMVYKP